MEQASASLDYERAATIRDQIEALNKLDDRGNTRDGWQPETEIAFINPEKGLASLQRALDMEDPIRCVEGIDIAHLQGGETVGSKVCFVDGKPFKDAYRRYRITSADNDDYASIREVVSRRYREAGAGHELLPGCRPDRRRTRAAARRDGRARRNGYPAAHAHRARQEGRADLHTRKIRADQARTGQPRATTVPSRPRRGPQVCPALPPCSASQQDIGAMSVHNTHMPSRSVLSTIACTALLVLSACSGAKMHRVELFVRGVQPSGETTPVRGARVTATPLGLSPVPLPVSGRSFAEQRLSPGGAEFTDLRGRVVFNLSQAHEYLIGVEAPITGGWSDHPDADFLLDKSWLIRGLNSHAGAAWLVEITPSASR